MLIPRLGLPFCIPRHKLQVSMAAYAREEALEGKHMAWTEDKQHLHDFFFSLELLWEKRWVLLAV